MGSVIDVDTRALRVFRVAMASVVILDCLCSLVDVPFLYSDIGLFPRADVLRQHPRTMAINPWMMSGSIVFGYAMFATTIGVALCNIFLRKWERGAAVGLWLLVAGLHCRVPAVLNGGDVLLQLLLWWSLWLPFGKAGVVRSVGSAALVLQVVMVYWFAFWHKSAECWFDGTALDAVFAIEHIRTGLARWLLDVPWLLKIGTWSTLLFEGLIVLLVFVPWNNKWWRVGVVVVAWAFHVGIAATLRIHIFPLVGVVAWLPFLPSEVWDWVDKWRRVDLIELTAVRNPWWAEGLALSALSVVVAWNAAAHDGKWEAIPKVIRQVASGFRLVQKWHLFSPFPYNGSDRVRASVYEDGDWEVVGECAGSYRARKAIISECKSRNRRLLAWFLRDRDVKRIQYAVLERGFKKTGVDDEYKWKIRQKQGRSPIRSIAYVFRENPGSRLHKIGSLGAVAWYRPKRFNTATGIGVSYFQ